MEQKYVVTKMLCTPNSLEPRVMTKNQSYLNLTLIESHSKASWGTDIILCRSYHKCKAYIQRKSDKGDMCF